MGLLPFLLRLAPFGGNPESATFSPDDYANGRHYSQFELRFKDGSNTDSVADQVLITTAAASGSTRPSLTVTYEY
jgi:hypothetical protein